MQTLKKQSILFICTGNYYRSRYAEAVFNHLARMYDLPWDAFSRGLNIDAVDGDISPFTEKALSRQRLDQSLTGSTRVSLSRFDLERADRSIALKEEEHRKLMQDQFPDWADAIDYWHVHDLDAATPEMALPQIHRHVAELVEVLVEQQDRNAVSASSLEF